MSMDYARWRDLSSTMGNFPTILPTNVATDPINSDLFYCEGTITWSNRAEFDSLSPSRSLIVWLNESEHLKLMFRVDGAEDFGQGCNSVDI